MDSPRQFKELCDLLRRLKGERVLLILESGDREWVKVVAVIGEVLVATLDRKFIFVDCDCICAVVADCLDLLSEEFGLVYQEQEEE